MTATPDVDGLLCGGWTVVDVGIERFEGTSLICRQSVDRNWLYFTEGGYGPARPRGAAGAVDRRRRRDDEEGKRLTGEEALAAEWGQLFKQY